MQHKVYNTNHKTFLYCNHLRAVADVVLLGLIRATENLRGRFHEIKALLFASIVRAKKELRQEAPFRNSLTRWKRYAREDYTMMPSKHINIEATLIGS